MPEPCLLCQFVTCCVYTICRWNSKDTEAFPKVYYCLCIIFDIDLDCTTCWMSESSGLCFSKQ